MKFLYAAYIAAWIIHIFYLISLMRGYARVRDEIRELKENR